MPLSRSESTSSAADGTDGERSPVFRRYPGRSLSSSSAVERPASTSLLRLVTARRAATAVHQHQLMPNGNCASTTTTATVAVPAYGVETTDEDALRQV